MKSRSSYLKAKFLGATRLRRICSEDILFFKRLGEFRDNLISSGYDISFIEPILNDVSKKDRRVLLFQKQNRSSSDRTPFVTTYHPQMPKIKSFHFKHNDILLKSDRMSKILPHPPIIALRRPKNLGDFLIKTKVHMKANNMDKLGGFQRCGQSRCQICSGDSSFGIFGTKIKSTVTGKVFNINSNLNCRSYNCIYVISCVVCNKQYVGKAITPLRKRFNNHRLSVRTFHKSIQYPTLAVPCHFNLPSHSGERDIRITAVELVPLHIKIESRESFWLWNLSCHRVTDGINIKEPYLDKLCLYN